MSEAVKEYQKERFRKMAESNIRNFAHRNATSAGDFSKELEYYMTCPLEKIFFGDLDEYASRIASRYGITL